MIPDCLFMIMNKELNISLEKLSLLDEVVNFSFTAKGSM